MMKNWMITALLALVACGGEAKKDETAKTPEAKPVAGVAAAIVTTDLGTAMSVAEAMKGAPIDEAVVLGRISKIVKGYAAFNLTDQALEYCGEKIPEDDCKTPWDYCCIDSATQTSNRLTVGIYDKDGNILKAADLPGLRLLDLVAIKGKVIKDEHGNVSIHATSIQRRERPKLPDDLRWP